MTEIWSLIKRPLGNEYDLCVGIHYIKTFDHYPSEEEIEAAIVFTPKEN